MRKLSCPGKLIMSIRTDEDFREIADFLHEGEGILFYTDGLIEQRNSKGDETFDVKRIETILQSISDDQKQHIIGKLVHDLEIFAGKKQFDDDIAIINVCLESSVV